MFKILKVGKRRASAFSKFIFRCLLLGYFPHLHNPHLFNLTTSMTPTILIDDDGLSDHEPTLSATPATAVLDQVEVQLGLAGKPASSNDQDSESFQRPPKRRRNSRGIEYVEVTLQKEGSRNAFYWQHGYEAECQRPNKKGKKETYWVSSKCHIFKAYGRTHGGHIKRTS